MQLSDHQIHALALESWASPRQVKRVIAGRGGRFTDLCVREAAVKLGILLPPPREREGEVEVKKCVIGLA